MGFIALLHGAPNPQRSAQEHRASLPPAGGAADTEEQQQQDASKPLQQLLESRRRLLRLRAQGDTAVSNLRAAADGEEAAHRAEEEQLRQVWGAAAGRVLTPGSDAPHVQHSRRSMMHGGQNSSHVQHSRRSMMHACKRDWRRFLRCWPGAGAARAHAGRGRGGRSRARPAVRPLGAPARHRRA